MVNTRTDTSEQFPVNTHSDSPTGWDTLLDTYTQTKPFKVEAYNEPFEKAFEKLEKLVFDTIDHRYEPSEPHKEESLVERVGRAREERPLFWKKYVTDDGSFSDFFLKKLWGRAGIHPYQSTRFLRESELSDRGAELLSGAAAHMIYAASGGGRRS